MESATEEESPPQCIICGQPLDSLTEGLPVCAGCYPGLVDRPLPRWIQVVTAFIGLVLVLSLVQFPLSLSAGIAFERGRRAEVARNYKLAEQQYAIVAKRFPSSTLAIARLGIVSYRAGDLLTAIKSFEKLGGRETSEELAGEVNAVADAMMKKLVPQEEGAQP